LDGAIARADARPPQLRDHLRNAAGIASAEGAAVHVAAACWRRG